MRGIIWVVLFFAGGQGDKDTVVELATISREKETRIIAGASVLPLYYPNKKEV